MRWCVENAIAHLLVESPSVDRMDDGGLLTNHHIYWSVPRGEHQSTEPAARKKTITESISIHPDLDDGIYLLNLQVPALCTDAAPSKPVLHSLELVDSNDESEVA